MKKVSIARIAVALGIIFCVCKLLSAGMAVWTNWVTPFEKRDIRQGLDQIDKVRAFQGQESREYRRQVAAARDSVGNCKKHIITEGDSQMVMLLETDLDSAVKRQEIWQLPDSNPRKREGLNFLAEIDGKIETMIRSRVM